MLASRGAAQLIGELAQSGEGRRMLMKYLEATIRFGASDLIVKVDLPPPDPAPGRAQEPPDP